MADLEETEQAPEQQLWERLAQVRAGMLGVTGDDGHMQPMSHFADRQLKTLYFVISRDAGLVRDIGQGATAEYVIVGDGQDYHASLRGPIRQSQDQARLEELWNSLVSAWFDGGPEDPNVVLLEMPLRDAAIWASTDSRVEFALEIAKAHVTGDDPDVGVRTHIDFATAA
jgi:general stress protein 26